MTINPNEQTLWEGSSETVAGLASGGKVGVARFKLTNLALYVTSGTLRTNSQQIPIHRVVDVDMSQTLAQKVRGIGDVKVHVIRPDNSRDELVLASVRGPAQVRDLINSTAHQAALTAQQIANTQTVHYNSTPPATTTTYAQPTLADQVRQLAELRDQGLLTDEEFSAKKAQLLGLA